MIKRMFILLLVLIFTIFTSSCKEKENNVNPDGSITETFTYFQGNAEDPQYYADYTGNPVYQYISQKVWDTNEDGVDVKVEFEFQSAPSGQGQNITNTMIATGSYTDIMDLSYYTGSTQELYKQGIAMDITYYVENYMPNYLSFLDAHPEYAKFSTHLVDGERKYLQIYSFHDYSEPFWGFNYRRDWIVEYADDVYPGTQFSRWEDENGYYVDDVIFPCGETDPFYISDWEWMLEIFDFALTAEGITDGYVMSLPYSGAYGTGDLMSAGYGYHLNSDKIEFGATSESMRAYLQMVSTWYERGWIDTHFPERTNQLFFQTGLENFMTGRVGIWYGGTYAHDDGLSTGLPNSSENGYTEDIFVMSAPQPINDIYGDESVQNTTPFAYYMPKLQYGGYIVTEKASDKELVALFSMLDYTFSQEGSIASKFGLNAEQYAELENGNALMEREGFTEGLYDWVEIDGVQKAQFKGNLYADTYLRNALTLNRIFALLPETYAHLPYSPTKIRSMELISYYPETGSLLDSFIDQLSIEDAETYSKALNNINSFLDRTIPGFVTGDKDPYSDADWNAYVNAVNKYGPDNVKVILQDLYDQFQD